MKNCSGGGGDSVGGAGGRLAAAAAEDQKQQDARQQQQKEQPGWPAKTEADKAKELEAALALRLQLVAAQKSQLKQQQQHQHQMTKADEGAFGSRPLDDLSLVGGGGGDDTTNYGDYDYDYDDNQGGRGDYADGDERNLDSGYAWIILLVMFLLSANVGGASRVYGLVYAKQVSLGYYDHEQASWPIATASTIENLAGILTPALARFLSWRKIQLLSTSLFILANVGAYFSNSLLIDILCLGVIQGLALSINTVLALAINNDYFERYRTTAYGIIMSGSTCGTFIMCPTISWILEGSENFRFAYLAIGAFFGLNILLSLLIMPRPSAPNWTLCCLAQQTEADQELSAESSLETTAAATTTAATTAQTKVEEQRRRRALADDIRSQKSVAGGSSSGRLSNWPNRKVSLIASHFERKSSVASISVQCRLSRQSSMSTADWLGFSSSNANTNANSNSAAAGGSGAAARPLYKGSVRGVPRGMSPNASAPNSIARSFSHQLELAAAGATTGYGAGSVRARRIPSGGALASLRKISQASRHTTAGGLGGTVTAEPGGPQQQQQREEGAREHKRSFISFRAPAVAYELELELERQQQVAPQQAETSPSDVTSSTATANGTPATNRPQPLGGGDEQWPPPPTFGHVNNSNSNSNSNTSAELTDAAQTSKELFEMVDLNNDYDEQQHFADDQPERFNLASALNLLKLPYLHCVWIMLSLYYLIARIFIIILADFADDHGLKPELARQLLNYWSLGEIFGRIILSSFIDLQWLSVKSCIVATCGALAASIALMVAVQGSYAVYALCSALVAAFVSLEYMLINVLMVEYLGKSRVLGCYSLGSLLSSLLLFGRPALIGLFRDQLGSYDGLLVLLAALTLAYALLFGLLEPLLVRRWPKAAHTAAAGASNAAAADDAAAP